MDTLRNRGTRLPDLLWESKDKVFGPSRPRMACSRSALSRVCLPSEAPSRRCQSSPVIGPPVLVQDGPLVGVTLHAKLLSADDEQNAFARPVVLRTGSMPEIKGLASAM
jgi:hypothetical protein